MKILFLHGLGSTPGGLKPTFLRNHGHEVLNPHLPDDDFDAAVRTAQAEFDQHQPDIVVGSSRGGAVAVNIDSKDTPLVLLCPAWKKWGSATTVKPNTTILHSRADDVVPFEDSVELVDTPHRSNKWIAKRLGTTHQTVKAVRKHLEAGGKIYPLERVEGEDGKSYPAGGGHSRPFFQGCNTPNPKQNDISTPPGICRFLFDLIWANYRPRVILDPCAGTGNLTRPWRGKARTVTFEIKRGKDFFARTKPLDEVGLVFCNPPFNGNPDSKELFPSRFLYHILELVPPDTPIVFFAPFGFLLNARSSTQIYAGRTNRYAWLRDNCPPITSIIPLPQDAFVLPDEEGPLVHSQILMFNMDWLEPCIFVPDDYLTW